MFISGSPVERDFPVHSQLNFVKRRKTQCVSGFHGDAKMSVNLQSKTLIDNWVEQVSSEEWGGPGRARGRE